MNEPRKNPTAGAAGRERTAGTARIIRRHAMSPTPRTAPRPLPVLLAVLALAVTTLGAALPALAASAPDAAPRGLAAVTPHYETVRLALVGDSLAGVPAAAREIRRELERLRATPTAERAGVAAAKLAEVEALLPEAIAAAAKLEKATSLGAARDALYALTKPLVRWRGAAGEGPTVAYCSMAERSWLQADDSEVGNPYYGKQMARCGEIVTR